MAWTDSEVEDNDHFGPCSPDCYNRSPRYYSNSAPESSKGSPRFDEDGYLISTPGYCTPQYDRNSSPGYCSPQFEPNSSPGYPAYGPTSPFESSSEEEERICENFNCPSGCSNPKCRFLHTRGNAHVYTSLQEWNSEIDNWEGENRLICPFGCNWKLKIKAVRAHFGRCRKVSKKKLSTELKKITIENKEKKQKLRGKLTKVAKEKRKLVKQKKTLAGKLTDVANQKRKLVKQKNSLADRNRKLERKKKETERELRQTLEEQRETKYELAVARREQEKFENKLRITQNTMAREVRAANSRAQKALELEKKVQELDNKRKNVEHQKRIAEREKVLAEKKAEKTAKTVKKQLTGKNRENKKLNDQVSNQRKLLAQERDKRIKAEQIVNDFQKRLKSVESLCVKWNKTAIVERDMRLKAEERVKQLERQVAFLKQTFQKELKKRKFPLSSEPPRKKPKLSPPESPIRVKKEPSNDSNKIPKMDVPSEKVESHSSGHVAVKPEPLDSRNPIAFGKVQVLMGDAWENARRRPFDSAEFKNLFEKYRRQLKPGGYRTRRQARREILPKTLRERILKFKQDGEENEVLVLLRWRDMIERCQYQGKDVIREFGEVPWVMHSDSPTSDAFEVITIHDVVDLTGESIDSTSRSFQDLIRWKQPKRFKIKKENSEDNF